MGRTRRALDLTCGWGGDKSCKKGTREMNESNRKQDGNAVQGEGLGRDEERKLLLRVWPLRRLSEMQKRCL